MLNLLAPRYASEQVMKSIAAFRQITPLEHLDHVDTVRRSLPPQTRVHVVVIPDTEPELKTVMEGVEALGQYKADQIVALGGGSVIDAAKMMSPCR
jgi:alcohol dehydrogenase class IV